MRKFTLMMAVALFACGSVYAQDEEEPVVLPVYTKSLNSVIADAKSIVASNHYTVGQAVLESAIATAEAAIPSLTDNDEMRKTLKELQSAIDDFIEANGHADATELLQNPSFNIDGNNSKTITSWTVTNFKQNRRSVSYQTTRSGFVITDFAEQWIASSSSLAGKGDLSQVVSNLPAGHYRLTADIFVHNQKYDATCEEAVGVEFYANESVREIGITGVTDNDAAAFSVDFDVTEGQDVTIGFRFENVNFNWLGIDNFTLTYIGDAEAFNSFLNNQKLGAAKEALEASIKAAQEALAAENAPLYRKQLEEAIDVANTFTASTLADEMEEAKSVLDTEVAAFKKYNGYYTNLKTAIEKAEALVAAGEMTVDVDKFQEAINKAKEELSNVATNYANAVEEAVALLETAMADLQKAELVFGVANASYAHPANVITNGSMSSTDGWEILVPGSNPGLHINTAGNVTNFSKPFMECWVNNTNYGQENYARQTVENLPNGVELPKGYYVLRAAALATRQDQASLEVSGVTIKLEDQAVAVHTKNGVGEIYTIGYDKQEAGGKLTFGLYIDENTDANWIAWDEVELQFVGDKDKYIADYTKAVLGESLEKLKAALAETEALMESVDMNGVDISNTDFAMCLDDVNFAIENPTADYITKEYLEQLIEQLAKLTKQFYTSGVSPKAGNHFDFTSFIKNAEFDAEPGEEWTVETENGVLPSGTDCPYWWFGSSGPSETTQEFSQRLYDMPAGNYLLDVNTAIRVDMNYSIEGYKAENLPENLTLCKVYANNDSTDVHPFFYEDEAQGLTLDKMLLMTNDYDYRHGNGTLIDDMLKGSEYFHSKVIFKLEKVGDIKIGFRVELPKKNGQMPFIDYFHLSYYGNQEINQETTPNEPSGITATKSLAAPAVIYNLNGQQVRKDATTQGLAKGLYIIAGKKVVVK